MYHRLPNPPPLAFSDAKDYASFFYRKQAIPYEDLEVFLYDNQPLDGRCHETFFTIFTLDGELHYVNSTHNDYDSLQSVDLLSLAKPLTSEALYRLMDNASDGQSLDHAYASLRPADMVRLLTCCYEERIYDKECSW